jgi:inner membrane transporter RhtA
MRRPPPHVYFLVSAVFHYLGPAFAVLLFARVDVLGVAWLRIASAALVFAIWRRPWRIARGLDREGRRLLLAWGAVLAAMNCCFYLAIDRLPLGTVAAIEFLPVVALAALGARTPRNALALALVIPGVPLLTGVHLGDEALALGLAAANAALFAGYIVLADRVAKHGGRLTGVDGLGASMLIAAVLVTPVAAPEAVPALTDPVALLAGVGVGLCSSVIPYVADQLALARLPRATYALMVALLPATATVIGIVVLTQVPEPAEVAGIALIVAGVALHRPATSGQTKGMRMTRSSSSEGLPRPSRLLVVSQSASPDGSTATVRMRPNAPSKSASGLPSLSPSTGIRQSRSPRSAPTHREPRA